MTTKQYTTLLSLASVLVLAFAGPGYAQDVPEGDNFGPGSLTTSGVSTETVPVVSIGHAGAELAHGMTYIGDSFSAPTVQSFIEIEPTGTNDDHYYFVRLPGSGSLRFTADTGTPSASTIFSEFINTGASLSFDGTEYAYTSKHGMVARFEPHDPAKPRLTTVESPTGATITYTYSGAEISSIQNNLGYQLKYQRDQTPVEVVAINNRFEYYNPAALSCAAGSQWASGTEGSGESSITDAGGGVYTVTEDSANDTVTLSLPEPGAEVVTEYNAQGYAVFTTRLGMIVSTIPFERDMGTPDPSDDRLDVVSSDADGGQTITTPSMIGGLPLSHRDGLGQTTDWTYNAENTLQSVTFPRGNSVEYEYDSRGNVTKVTRKAGPTGGGNVTDFVTTIAYPSSCTAATQSYCNKPTYVIDQAGGRTDYTYHASSGQVASITGPDNGVGRPVTEYSYFQQRARVRTSTGAYAWSDWIWKLQSVERFHGTPQAVTTTLTYDYNRNLTPKTATVTAAGQAALVTTFGYDNYGNRISVDGPFPGGSDRVTNFYDAMRRVTGTIGGDPDAAGTVLHAASRYTRNNVGMVTAVETGTATGDSALSLIGMTVHETQTTTYDATTLRATDVTVLSGTTPEALMEYSYDSVGRVECAALRMDPAAGPTGDACTAGSPGIFGFDRITRSEYDLVGRVERAYSGYGSPAQSMQEYEYWDFGPVKYARDGNGNQTYYTYDAHNRLNRTYYPDPSGSGHNLYDKEQIYYTDEGWRASVRQRDNQLVQFSYYPSGRLQAINAPGTGEDTTAVYDIAGRLLSVSKPGDMVTYTYDGMGRRLTETGGLGTVTYGYDTYGRRTSMDYPGTHDFTLNYTYHGAGLLDRILLNNSTQLAEYTYDARGRRDEVRRGPADAAGDHDNVTRFGYGALSRLTSLESDLEGPSTSASDQLLSFTYTPAGQIRSQTSSNPIYDPLPADYLEDFYLNGLNQITDRNGQAFTYDGAGNLTASPDGSFGYDYANRLTSITRGGTVHSLEYDAVSRLVEAGSRAFGYAGSTMISENTLSNGSALAFYVHDDIAECIEILEAPLLRLLDRHLIGAVSTRRWSKQRGQLDLSGKDAGPSDKPTYSTVPYKGWDKAIAYEKAWK